MLSGSMFEPLYLRDPSETTTYNPDLATRVRTVYSNGNFQMKSNILKVHFRTSICDNCGASDIFMIVHLFLNEDDYN